jgi:glycosyltransferase involved in cell wall biosynthesis
MFPDWQWEVQCLPPRYFSWRVRGNPLYWSISERAVLERDYDLLLATSMVDLATLRGLVPALSRLPTVLYFHENQFDYPQDRQRHNLLEAQMVSLYGALAADRILFNSAYNRRGFLVGCETLLAKMPDKVPAGIAALLADKSEVLPVPLDIDDITVHSVDGDWPGRGGGLPQRPLRLLWVGRFEHDKGPDGLLRILRLLEQSELNWEIALVGQQFRNSPPAFRQIEEQFRHRLVHCGFLESVVEYQQLLRGGDMVLSTALHEFQGLAVLEAVAAGCLPVVPDRLVYPEILPQRFCYPCSDGDALPEAAQAVNLILSHAAQLLSGAVQAPDVSAYGFNALVGKYREVFLSPASNHR